MPDRVSISHRGARYEIGLGKRYYAVWATGAPRDEPVDRWPETPEGWSQAWARFTAIETPGTITTVPRAGVLGTLRRAASKGNKGNKDETGDAAPASPRRQAAMGLVAVAFLGLGVAIGIAGLFPDYFSGQSLASVAEQLVPHALYLATWACAAGLIVSGRSRARAGALVGTGLSAVTFGLFAADLATGTSAHAGVGAGMVISLLGWLACAVGSVLALRIRPAAGASPQPASGASAGLPGALGRPALGRPRPRRAHAEAITLLALCALGTAICFVPSWDSYTLAQSSTGAAQTVTAGNAFSNPGWVIFGDMATVVALVAVAVLAAVRRPLRLGGALLAGAIVAMVAQAISALIQVSHPASPEIFGISAQQAQANGLTVSSGVTGIFWVYVVFVVALAISCAWLLTAPGNPVPANLGQTGPLPGNPASTGQADSVGLADTAESGAEDRDDKEGGEPAQEASDASKDSEENTADHGAAL